MLEPTDIHSYEPPRYRVRPPSPTEVDLALGLNFDAIVLESANAVGGPSPAVLHLLREHGCKLILALCEDAGDQNGFSFVESSTGGVERAALDREWFDAVFDKVISISPEPGGHVPLERYMTDAGLTPKQAVCFACTPAGARIFTAADAGLVIAHQHDIVWSVRDGGHLRLAGADIAARRSPTIRQLTWLHRVYTQKTWCTCLWLVPATDEFPGVAGDRPSIEDRALLSRVSNSTISARGHPPWLPLPTSGLNDPPPSWPPGAPPACTVKVAGEVLACPDWTQMETRLQKRGGFSFPLLTRESSIELYCHTLDVGLAQVNHAIEVVTKEGLRLRINSRRFVNLANNNQAAAELSVTILELPAVRGAKVPDIVIRSRLGLDQCPEGFSTHPESVEVDLAQAKLGAAFWDHTKERNVTVEAWHRFARDGGQGEVSLRSSTTDVVDVRRAPNPTCVGDCVMDLVFVSPRKGTRYIIEKVVSVTSSSVDQPSFDHMSSRNTDTGRRLSDLVLEEAPSISTLPEIEEEHCSAWRVRWDYADIEIAGNRRAERCQRAMRLFRFHQVSSGDTMASKSSEDQVPPLVGELFQATFKDMSEGEVYDRPSKVVTSRVAIRDVRSGIGTVPTVRIDPKVPPACNRMRFNAALGGRWHRFTLSPGKVQILVQGPLLSSMSLQLQLFGQQLTVAPKFYIPSSDGDDGVEVFTVPWQEVHVQHALTELGRPDGSTGGFYSLMRRTRYIRAEVLRRLLADVSENDGESGDYRHETLVQPLRHALSGLRSVPRPPGWGGSREDHTDADGLEGEEVQAENRCRDNVDGDVHMLEADSHTSVRVMLQYEKTELTRDVSFLEGTVRGPFKGQIATGDDLVEAEVSSLHEAKLRCAAIPGCRGFTYQGDAADTTVKVSYKSNCQVDGTVTGWTSYIFEDGEQTVLKMLQEDHERTFRDWVPPADKKQVEALGCQNWKDWNTLIEDTTAVLEDEHDERRERKPFRNFITDRDGTSNNYCDRYASSVQSAYNAAWLSHFAKYCAVNAVVITAAPLGGKPSAEGLLDLCVAPTISTRGDRAGPGVFIYAGSKGREYFDHKKQRVLATQELADEQRVRITELHRRLLVLCTKPGNTKFLGIGSGLQRKFGEVTMARNDPERSVPEPESRRFMAAVRGVMEELDPDGTALDLKDTSTDMEIFPRAEGGRASFDKGDGVKCLNGRLNLRVEDGPNLVCGDTSSDIAMIEATLRLMCGDSFVDSLLEAMNREEKDRFVPAVPEVDEIVDEELLTEEDEANRMLKEEMEQRKREEHEELKWKKGSKLVVLFVVSPKQHADDPGLAKKVRKMCELAGARCAILPSPDVLVASLAQFAKLIAGRRVTEPLDQDSLVVPESSPTVTVAGCPDVRKLIF